MPKIAHLILAHKNPKQLEQLINSVRHADADIYIHIDKKVPINPFLYLESRDVIFIEKRYRINWGSYNLLKATLESFKTILSNKKYDFCNLLSGADYPLKSADYIHQFLDRYKDKSFTFYHTNEHSWWDHARLRLNNIFLVNYQLRGKFRIEQLLKILKIRKDVPDEMEFVGRSQWFTLCAGHMKYVIFYLRDNPSFDKFLRFTWGTDEFAVQTILYNSVHKMNLINDDLRYTEWTEGAVSPKVLSVSDLEKMKNSGKLFARKFDLDRDRNILEELDKLKTVWESNKEMPEIA